MTDRSSATGKSISRNERILIYRLGSMGDTVVSLPCLYARRRRYQMARIALLTSRLPDARAISAATLLDGTGLVDQYMAYQTNTRAFRELRAIRREIRSFEPSLLIYLTEPRGLFRTYRDYLFFRWCGIRHIIGVPFARDLRERRPPKSGSYLWESEADRLARCIASVGSANLACNQNWNLCLTNKELSTALQLLRPKTRFMGLAIGARQPAKDWGVENWRAVLAGIADRTLGLVLIGAGSERDRSNDVAIEWPGLVINLCGETSPRLSAAVIRHLNLVLCHDGGPMHLAAAVGTPCIAIFSRVNRPGEWFPFGADHKIFHPGSIGTIQPSRVIDAVQDALALARGI